MFSTLFKGFILLCCHFCSIQREKSFHACCWDFCALLLYCTFMHYKFKHFAWSPFMYCLIELKVWWYICIVHVACCPIQQFYMACVTCVPMHTDQLKIHSHTIFDLGDKHMLGNVIFSIIGYKLWLFWWFIANM